MCMHYSSPQVDPKSGGQTSRNWPITAVSQRWIHCRLKVSGNDWKGHLCLCYTAPRPVHFSLCSELCVCVCVIWIVMRLPDRLMHNSKKHAEQAGHFRVTSFLFSKRLCSASEWCRSDDGAITWFFIPESKVIRVGVWFGISLKISKRVPLRELGDVIIPRRTKTVLSVRRPIEIIASLNESFSADRR